MFPRWLEQILHAPEKSESPQFLVVEAAGLKGILSMCDLQWRNLPSEFSENLPRYYWGHEDRHMTWRPRKPHFPFFYKKKEKWAKVTYFKEHSISCQIPYG
jgi:hypothetical protein